MEQGTAEGNAVRDWRDIGVGLRRKLGDVAFHTWLSPLRLWTLDDDRVVLAAPSRFVRDYVQANFLKELTAAWQGQHPKLLLVEIIVKAPTANLKTATPSNVDGASVSTQIAPSFPAEKAQSQDDRTSSLKSGVDGRARFDSFVTDQHNQVAAAAAKRVVSAFGSDEQQSAYNPFVVFGGVGLGKSHLLQAVANALADRADTPNVAYVSAEKFLYGFVRALRHKSMDDFKQFVRSLDVLILDDLQYALTSDATQEELVNSIDHLIERGGQVIVAVNQAPADIDNLSERLKSRLSGGLVVDLPPTTFELRREVVEKLNQRSGADLSTTLLDFVASQITANIRELEGAFNRLVAHASLSDTPITLQSAQRILRDLLRNQQRQLTIAEIQKQVALHFDIDRKDMMSKGRMRSIARPRQVAMYLSKTLTTRSLPEIGRQFGGRDHTTVLHAVRKIEALLDSNQGFAQDVDHLKNLLDS